MLQRSTILAECITSAKAQELFNELFNQIEANKKAKQ